MENYQKQLDNIISNLNNKPTLALHSCCGPCSTYVLKYLTQFFNVTLLFYNPNIQPEAEYQKRLETQKTVCNELGVKLVDFNYNTTEFLNAVKGFENEKEGGARCTECFKLRLNHGADYAAKNGFDFFTTTLTVSPHKNAWLINELGQGICKSVGINWLPSDFKKKNGYLTSITLSKQYGLYRQDYCGCIFSKTKDTD